MDARGKVTLSYRSEAFGRVKPANRERLRAMQDKGVVRVLLKSSVKSIGETDVVLSCEGEKEQRMRNDAVIVCAGGDLPFDLLKKVGVSFETHRGAAKVQ